MKKIFYEIIKKLEGNYNVEILFDYNFENFYDRKKFYYIDKNQKIQTGILYRVCNSFFLKFNPNFPINPFVSCFLPNLNSYIFVIVKVSNLQEKIYYSNFKIHKLKDILDNKKMVYKILEEYFSLKPHAITKHRSEILKKYLLGSSYTEIGREYGISRQRVEQICKNFTFLSLKNYYDLFRFTFPVIKKLHKKYSYVMDLLSKFHEYPLDYRYFCYYATDNINIIEKYFSYVYLDKNNKINIVLLNNELGDYNSMSHYCCVVNIKVIKFIDRNKLSKDLILNYHFKHDNKDYFIIKPYMNLERIIYINKKEFQQLTDNFLVIK